MIFSQLTNWPRPCWRLSEIITPSMFCSRMICLRPMKNGICILLRTRHVLLCPCATVEFPEGISTLSTEFQMDAIGLFAGVVVAVNGEDVEVELSQAGSTTIASKRFSHEFHPPLLPLYQITS